MIAEKQCQVASYRLPDGSDIKYVKQFTELISQENLSFKYDPQTDLIKNIYEGGFKVWECTFDLLNYLVENRATISFKNKSVMDLGCGHGLLGILALREGAEHVLFQDFNQEVLHILVKKNLALNQCSPKDLEQRVIFLSGDWDFLQAKISKSVNEFEQKEKCSQYPQKFDILLLSEVIYNQENYAKIANLVLRFLAEDGLCIMANKLFYFGVGGSMPEFKEYIDKQYAAQLIQSSLVLINNKKGNKREIIKLEAKKP